MSAILVVVAADESPQDSSQVSLTQDDDVAEAILFFCSDRARMITGESLLVNAGEIMR